MSDSVNTFHWLEKRAGYTNYLGKLIKAGFFINISWRQLQPLRDRNANDVFPFFPLSY
jgi:hypothetical protein